MKFLAAMALILATSSTATAHPPPASPLSPSIQALRIAAQAGTDYRPVDWPYSAPDFTLLLQAIMLQESSLCTNTHGDDPSGHGCMQLHLKTASDGVGVNIDPWVLEHNWTLNIRIAAVLLRSYWQQTHSWRHMLSMYHQGQYFKDIDWNYVHNVMRLIDSLPHEED